MEAIAASNRGLMAAGPVHTRMVPSPTRKRGNLVLSAHKAFVSGTPLRTSTLATQFEDQSHVQFYLNVRCSRKEKKSKHGSKGNSRYNMERMSEGKESKIMRKMRFGSSSSSSSSSSESSDWDWDSRGTVTMGLNGRKKFVLHTDDAQPREKTPVQRKFDMYKFNNDSEVFSISELMKSISQINDESPVDATMEKIRKAFNLPTTSPPPPMVDSEESYRAPISRVSNSLTAVAGVAVGEDISDSFSVADIKPAAAHVKVCMGGKCKNAGACEVLNAFQVAGRPGVTASPSKCMKNCKAAVSISIEDQQGRSQSYTRVGLNDVDMLLQRHCSLKVWNDDSFSS